MTGVDVISKAGPMTCSRDLITGSHVLRWYCRLAEDPAQFQLGGSVLFALR